MPRKCKGKKHYMDKTFIFTILNFGFILKNMKNLTDPINLAKLNNHLKSGGVIAFPTDTVWGLGALPTRAGADALFEIKRRPANKHLIIMSDSLEHIKPYMINYPKRAFELAQKYWPGALTLGVPVAGTDSMVFGGVRVPNYKPFMELCAVIDGHCLATTSANISGQPPLTSAKEIKKVFPDIIVIDNADSPMGGAPSTVAILDGDDINIVRPGGVVIK